MDCKIIRTWILTDYLDGELDFAKRQTLEGHLKNCRACANLLEEAKANVVKPFEDPKKPSFDQEYLWDRIKAKIEPTQTKTPDSTLGRIIQGFRVPKPVFALSTCAALLLAVFVLTQTSALRALYQKAYYQQSATASLEEQLEYFASDETSSFGTDTENSFF